MKNSTIYMYLFFIAVIMVAEILLINIFILKWINVGLVFIFFFFLVIDLLKALRLNLAFGEVEIDDAELE